MRMIVGTTGFAWAAFFFIRCARGISPDPLWPLYLLGGAALGVAATRVTRDAGRGPMGVVLALLGALALGALAWIAKPSPASDVYAVEFLPWETFIAVTLLPIPTWLFMSSRAGVQEGVNKRLRWWLIMALPLLIIGALGGLLAYGLLAP